MLSERLGYPGATFASELEGDGDKVKIPRDRDAVASDAAEMRDKIAAHKPPQGPLDIKGGPGGLVDLEFAMQVTQLATGHCHDPNIAAALACLKAAGLAPDGVCEAHGLLARMLVMLRLTAPEGWWALSPVCVMQSRQGRGLGGGLAALVRSRNAESGISGACGARQCPATFNRCCMQDCALG